MQEFMELSILVVDDNKTTLDQMCDALRHNGIEQLVCARNTKEIWKSIDEEIAYRGRVFDFMFCNCRFNMKFGGPSIVVPKVLEKHPSIIAVMYSSGEDPFDHIAAMMVLGGADYISTKENFSNNLSSKLKKWFNVGRKRLELYEDRCSKNCCSE